MSFETHKTIFRTQIKIFLMKYEILWLKFWAKPLKLYGLVLQSLYELFEASKWLLCSCQWKDKSLRFHQKDLNLCSEDERMSYGFGPTWTWENDDIIFYFWVNCPFKSLAWTNCHSSWKYFDPEQSKVSEHFPFSPCSVIPWKKTKKHSKTKL